jgi:hypothetical protein
MGPEQVQEIIRYAALPTSGHNTQAKSLEQSCGSVSKLNSSNVSKAGGSLHYAVG